MKSSKPKISKENKLMDEFILSVFYDIDNFCVQLKNLFEHSMIPCDEQKSSFELPSALSLSEVMTICVIFHLSGYRTFKWYDTKLIQKEYHKFFSNPVSYNRFMELMPYATVLFVHSIGFKSLCTGINFVDSTTLDVCNSHRIQQHKAFQGIAQRSKCSTGWFYGFKLHLIIHDCREILSFCWYQAMWMTVTRKSWNTWQKTSLESCFLTRAMFPRSCLRNLWIKVWSLLLNRRKMPKTKGY